MSLKGQVKYSCAAERFEKRVKAEFSNVSYTLFLTGIKHFTGGIFSKPMLMYDQGVVKIQKKGKQRYCFNHVYGSLISMTLDLINKWGFPCCIYDPTLVEIHQSMWKIEPNVNPFHNWQQQKTTTTDNNYYRDKAFPCVFPAKAGYTIRHAKHKSRQVITFFKVHFEISFFMSNVGWFCGNKC